MSNEYDALVCTLRLLFDGKDVKDIARAVHDATDWRFHGAYKEAAECWAVYSVYPDWVREHFEENGLYNDMEGWFIGDDAACRTIARSLLDSISDNTYDSIRDDLRMGVSYMLDNNPQWFLSEDAAIAEAAAAGVELNI